MKEVLFHLVSLRSIFHALSSQQGLKPKLQSNLVRGQLINQRLARVRSNQWTCEAVGQAGKAGWPQLQLEGEDGRGEVAYDPPTFMRISRTPLVPDEYEEETVVVGMSSVPGAGEGLFAR